MNEKVKQFLDAKKEAEQKKYEEEKQKTLIDLGLFEKVYSEREFYSDEFPFFEPDSENSEGGWYKKEAFSVTDAEFEEVKKYSKKEETSKTNTIASILTFIAGLVFIGGFISGLVLGNVEVVKDSYYTYTETEFSFAVAFTYWCDALISGTMFLGFAEIIKLLNDIKNK